MRLPIATKSLAAVVPVALRNVPATVSRGNIDELSCPGRRLISSMPSDCIRPALALSTCPANNALAAADSSARSWPPSPAAPGGRPSTSQFSFSTSGMDGSEYSRTIGRAAVPPIETPTSTGNPVRTANTFSAGFSTGP